MLKQRKQPHPGVFVLGMHRSGTSAAVLCLESLGLNLCIPEDRLKSGGGNPDHGESLSVITFNDTVMSMSNADWARPKLSEGWINDPEVQAMAAPARTRFLKMHPKKPWAVKDPRLCLTLPFWEEALDINPPILLIVRNPLEVAASLRKREATYGKVKTDEYYYSMWERYMRSALFYSQGHPVFVVNFSDLIDEWPAYRARIAKWLAWCGFELPEEENDSPVESMLRHTNMRGSMSGLSYQQKRLYQALSEIRGEHGFLKLPKVGRESEKTAHWFGPERYVRKSKRQTGPSKIIARIFPQLTTKTAKYRLMRGLQLAAVLAISSVPLILLSATGIAHSVNTWVLREFAAINQPILVNAFDLTQDILASDALYWIVIALAVVCVLFGKRMSAATLLVGLALSILIWFVSHPFTGNASSFFAAKLFQVVVLFGLIVYTALKTTHQKIIHMLAMVVCGLVVGIMALGRLYLQVHTPTAVIASVLLGAAMIVALVTLSESLRGYGQIPKRS